MKELYFFGPLRELGEGEHSAELEETALATEEDIKKFIHECMAISDPNAKVEFVHGQIRITDKEVSGEGSVGKENGSSVTAGSGSGGVAGMDDLSIASKQTTLAT